MAYKYNPLLDLGLDYYEAGASSVAFLDLTDTPSSYSGEGGKGVRVNAGATELEFYTLAGATDEKVGVDSLATAGYIGAASNDGVLRTSSPLTYADGGDFITLAIDETAIDHDNLLNFAANEHFTEASIDHNAITNLDYASAGHTGFEPTVSKGNLTETTSSVLTIVGGTGAVIGGGTTIEVDQADTDNDGYLSSIDWDTFNGKESALTFSTGLTRTINTITTNDGEINHDSLNNFSADEHFLQTAITNVSTALATGILKVTTGTGALSSITDNSANWDTAYGWGDHSVQNYFDKDTDTLDNIPDGSSYERVAAAELTSGIYKDATTAIKGIASYDSNHFSVGSGAVSLVADGVDTTLVDWGTGANQVSSDDIPLGTPTDGDWTDGTNAFTTSTIVADAIDELNETMSYLAPDDAQSMDGDTLSTSGVSFYTGRLSAGNTNYKGGDAAGSTVSYITNDGTFTISSPNQTTTFNKADEGDLDYFLNGAQNDTIDLATNFDEADRAGIQSGTPWTGAASNLVVDDVRWYNDFPKWQKGNADVTVVPGDLRQGYNYVTLKHTDIATTQETATLDAFYDNDAGANPSVNTPTLAENTPSTRDLSGITFYDRTSTFNLSVIGSDCFDNVYHQTSPLTYSSSSSTMGSGNIDYDDGSVSGVSDPPAIGETMTVTNKVLTVPNSNVRNMSAVATVTPRDPYGSYSSGSSASVNRLIDAYTTTSTAIYEYFDDENRRLPDNDGSAYPDNYDSVPSPITGQWTSATTLSDGEAQVYNGRLYYPTIDFSGYTNPAQGGDEDYSGFSGDQVYLKAIYDAADPHSSGQLELGNLINSDVGAVGAGNVNVEIKLPTQTGWLDLGTDYVQATFTGADGDGCRTAQSGDDWSWTAGTFSTADSGSMIIVRISLRNSTKYITQIRELGW